jgi:hypothetical protein
VVYRLCKATESTLVVWKQTEIQTFHNLLEGSYIPGQVVEHGIVLVCVSNLSLIVEIPVIDTLFRIIEWHIFDRLLSIVPIVAIPAKCPLSYHKILFCRHIRLCLWSFSVTGSSCFDV